MSETNKATFVIVAPNNYDVKKYSLGVLNKFSKVSTMKSYRNSEIEFEFNQTDENGNFVAIVEYTSKEPLKNPRITLFDGTIDESKSYKPRNLFQDNKRLPFAYPDNNESDSNNNKSQIFKIELCESHEATLQKMHDNELCYEYWTEDQLNKCKGNLSKNESNIGQQDQIEQTELNIEEEEEDKTDQKENNENYNTTENNENDNTIENNENDNTTKNNENDNTTENHENDNATENHEIPLITIFPWETEHVNALLLNGEFHFLNNQNDKIYLEKSKEYKIEPVYYDNEKQKFYYFPKSYVYTFNTFHINDSSIKLIIDDKFDMYFENDNDAILDKKPINHEKSSNLELGFGGVAGAGAIGSGIAIVFGFNPIVAIIIIAVLAATCLGLFIHGGIKKSKIYTPPKEDKSQKPETEYSDESNPTFNQGNDDPIWTSVKSQSQDSNENQPLFETNNDDIFQNNGEEEDWGEPI